MVNMGWFLARSCAEGPGWRAVVWVQGCAILCKGCCNPHLLPFVDNQWISVDDLAQRIITSPDIEGVTFLGGEPIAQAWALGKVAQQVQAAGLSVTVFSGYTYEELMQLPHAHYLLAYTDLLLAGPFIQEQYTDKQPWVGSDNQTIHFLTSRYRHLQHHWQNSEHTNTVEIRISSEQIAVNGFAYANVFRAIAKHIRTHGQLSNNLQGHDD